MKAYNLATILKATVLVILLMGSTYANALFSGGSGTDEDPYLIATASQLDSVRYYLSSVFKQTADIDLGVEPYNQGEGWEPIGTFTPVSAPFTGKFYGDGYVIYHLMINHILSRSGSLFGSISNATLINIQVYNATVTGIGSKSILFSGGTYNNIVNCHVTGNISSNNTCGGLASSASYSTIYVCSSKCNITGGSTSGGLIGSSSYCTITDCNSKRIVTGYGAVGGLIGMDSHSTINNCYSTANVSATAKGSGGLIGRTYYTNIDYCYALGDVNGTTCVGGIGGHIDYTNINNCFARGHITGTSLVGGLVGEQCVYSNVSKSYSTGVVSGINYVGGLVGKRTTTGFNVFSYWDTESSGRPSSDGGMGRTTAEMTFPYADNTFSGWDFVATWQADPTGEINEGYPYLFAMPVTDNQDEYIPVVNNLAISNYPNPFSNNTTISFSLPKSSKLNLSIYNTKGQLVRTLINNTFTKGENKVQWDGKTDSGTKASGGVYIYKLTGNDVHTSGKMILLK
jgi:hypothetical protein